MALFARQKAALNLLDRAGGMIEKTRLVKLAFLLRHERMPEDQSFYGFVPYQFGPFSFALYHDMDKLADAGWIESGEDGFRLIDRIRKPNPMPPEYVGAIDGIWGTYGRKSTSALVDDVYARYPWYTARCKNVAKRAATIPTAAPAIYTAGYEGLGLDDFLDRLLRAGIHQLIDVRKNPVARRFGFHRSTMARACDHLGIRYRHVPDLGIPGELRIDLDSQAARDRLFAIYRKDILPRQEQAIAQVQALMTATPSVLVCMEAKPCECHRTHLGRELVKRTGLPLLDLGEVHAAC
jgi:uncharacterized protein (DUF488 family)